MDKLIGLIAAIAVIAFCVVVGFGFAYGVAAFVTLDWNVLEWGAAGRLYLLVFGMFFSVIAAVIVAGIIDEI
jgi:hypothetical protein